MKLSTIILAATLVAFPFADATPQTKRAGCFPPKHAKVPSIAESKYSSARRQLLRAGWQPYDFRKTHWDSGNMSGNTKEMLELGRHEVEHCFGTGAAYCKLRFFDTYGNKLVVNTRGELVMEGKKILFDVTVDGVGFDCNDDE